MFPASHELAPTITDDVSGSLLAFNNTCPVHDDAGLFCVGAGPGSGRLLSFDDAD